MDENVNEEVKTEGSATEIIGIRFRESGKIYYFAPNGIKAEAGQSAIVETARGIEYGKVVLSNRFVGDDEVVLPLRPVIRIATKEDEEQYLKNKSKETEAAAVFVDNSREMKLGMKLIGVEYTFDCSKLLFYFTADGRVDFREFVKELASIFKTRIELRQIGIRDETKMIGGLGVCGRPYCCCRFLDDFEQVSIKMAKEQNMSLNSQKISGACGRLMCCLRYEHSTYEEALKSLPKVDSKVTTPDGSGSVSEVIPLAGLVKVRIGEGDQQTIKVYDASQITVTAPSKKEETTAQQQTAETDNE